jgi:hypothetical protein
LALLFRETGCSKLTSQADVGPSAGGRDVVGSVRENGPMSIQRIAWLTTVLVALLTALLLLLSGYTGYAGLGLAVAASAAINLL